METSINLHLLSKPQEIAGNLRVDCGKIDTVGLAVLVGEQQLVLRDAALPRVPQPDLGVRQACDGGAHARVAVARDHAPAVRKLPVRPSNPLEIAR